MLTVEELVTYLKDFEEQKSRKRAQEKENIYHKHEIKYETRALNR